MGEYDVGAISYLDKSCLGTQTKVGNKMRHRPGKLNFNVWRK